MDEVDGIPDSSNVFGQIFSGQSAFEVSNVFRKNEKWKTRECTWTDFEARSQFGELIIEEAGTTLFHGCILPERCVIESIADLLRSAEIEFGIEVYRQDGEIDFEVLFRK